TVFPYMMVSDANAFLGFLSKVFGATEIGRSVFPDGRIANIRITIGTSNFMVSEATDDMQVTPAAYYIYVEDVDATFDKAIACGATEIFAAADMPYQDRQAGVKDPFGMSWWISNRLVTKPYDS
ncbi:MAG: VOC family protein, partial [Pseudomonadota bacterium]